MSNLPAEFPTNKNATMKAKSEGCSEILKNQHWFDNGDAQIGKEEHFSRGPTEETKALVKEHNKANAVRQSSESVGKICNCMQIMGIHKTFPRRPNTHLDLHRLKHQQKLSQKET